MLHRLRPRRASCRQVGTDFGPVAEPLVPGVCRAACDETVANLCRVVDAAESLVLAGVIEATEAGLIAPLLIGEEKRIRRQLKALASPPAMPVIEPAAEESVADCGVRLMREHV
jgi:hypothetical protein